MRRIQRRRPFALFLTVAGVTWLLLLVWTRARLEESQGKNSNIIRLRPSPSFALHHYSTSGTRTSRLPDNQTAPEIVATFNEIPLSYHDKHQRIRSSYYCTGRSPNRKYSGREDSWMFRSCRFQNVCFDSQKQDYVMFMEPSETKDWTMSISEQSLALGGINPRWDLRSGEDDKGSWKVKWFPEISSDRTSETGFYQLPPNVILLPFHSFAAHNVGHLIWDDFYPIFSLLRLFDLLGQQQQEEIQLLPIRQVLDHKLYATCDIRPNKRQLCAANFAKFWGLMGVPSHHFSTSKAFRLQPVNEGENLKSTLVCGRAVAGLGMLSDHGYRDHGWNENATFRGYNIPPHNLGRGPNFDAFSRFMLSNLLGSDIPPPAASTIRVTFSILSSRDKDRRLDFASEIEYLQQVLPGLFQVEAHALWNMTSTEQIRLAQSSDIFITACGGGSMTSTFMRPGTSLILYFSPTGGIDFSTLQSLPEQPARLDWDLLDQAGRLRVHWWPILRRQATREEQQNDWELLHQLILHESQLLLDGV